MGERGRSFDAVGVRGGSERRTRVLRWSRVVVRRAKASEVFVVGGCDGARGEERVWVVARGCGRDVCGPRERRGSERRSIVAGRRGRVDVVAG